MVILKSTILGVVPAFATTVNESGDYLKAVYPIAPDQFTNELISVRFQPSLASLQQNFHGAEADAGLLLQLGKSSALFNPTTPFILDLIGRPL